MSLDEHHYRHVLISQLRKVYADANAATPKRYTYEEWQYFLKLLGENEEDASYHRKPPTSKEEQREAAEIEQNNNPETGKTAQDRPGGERGRPGEANAGADRGTQVTKWSWIGAQSPLMGDQEEAEWLLERFFQRLEESLKSDERSKQGEKATEYSKGLHTLSSMQGGEDSSSSDKAVSRD